ncbi:hypothetical protein PENTCL1PPCAC_4135, partial [Pristionchus entomophagus]
QTQHGQLQDPFPLSLAFSTSFPHLNKALMQGRQQQPPPLLTPSDETSRGDLCNVQLITNPAYSAMAQLQQQPFLISPPVNTLENPQPHQHQTLSSPSSHALQSLSPTDMTLLTGMTQKMQQLLPQLSAVQGSSDPAVLSPPKTYIGSSPD